MGVLINCTADKNFEFAVIFLLRSGRKFFGSSFSHKFIVRIMVGWKVFTIRHSFDSWTHFYHKTGSSVL